MLHLIWTNRFFFLPYFIFLLLGGVLQLIFNPVEIFLFVNTNYSSPTDYFFQYITHLGDGLFFILIVLLFTFISYQKALIALCCFGVSSIIAQGLKHLWFLEKLRPKAFFENTSHTLHFVEGITVHSFHSFPSGHATTAFSLFCLLSILFRQKFLGIIWFLLAIIAAYSRIYLSQHFFADIFAGSVIGVVTTVSVYLFLDTKIKQGKLKWTLSSLLQHYNEKKSQSSDLNG